MTQQSDVDDLRRLHKASLDEEIAANRVRNSKEYEGFQTQIQDLCAQRDAMLPKQDSQLEYEDLKKKIVDHMKKNGVGEVEGVNIKYRETKAVNNSRFMEVIGGDFDIFESLATITQKSLTEFAKTEPGLKKPLMDCVEVLSRDVSDIELINEG